MSDKCPHCEKSIIPNGNGFKKDLAHQEQIGNLEHQRLTNDMQKTEEKITTMEGRANEKETALRNKIDNAVQSLHEKIGSKFQFTLTTTMAILTLLVIFSTASDANLGDDIKEIKLQLNEDEKHIHRNTAIIDAILKGNIVLQNDVYVKKELPFMP